MENASNCKHETVLRYLFSENIQTGARKYVYTCKACRESLGHEACGQFADSPVVATITVPLKGHEAAVKAVLDSMFVEVSPGVYGRPKGVQ